MLPTNITSTFVLLYPKINPDARETLKICIRLAVRFRLLKNNTNVFTTYVYLRNTFRITSKGIGSTSSSHHIWNNIEGSNWNWTMRRKWKIVRYVEIKWIKIQVVKYGEYRDLRATQYSNFGARDTYRIVQLNFFA